MFFVHIPVGWMCHDDKLPEGIYAVMTGGGGHICDQTHTKYVTKILSTNDKYI